MLLLFLLFFWQTVAPARTLGGTMVSYTVQDGLAHNNILDIFTDSRGFVWLCTWNGVSRYDGYHFKNYSDDFSGGSVQHNRFVSVSEDAMGYLWFSTYDSHLYRYDPYSDRFGELESAVPELEGVNWHVGEVLCCKQSPTVLVAFSGLGLVRFTCSGPGKPLVGEQFFDDALIGKDITMMAETGDGKVWVVCDGGYRVVSMAPGTVPEARRNFSEPVVALATGSDGIVFASASHVYPSFCGEVDRGPVRIDGGISSLAFSDDGSELYAGTHTGGVVVLDDKMEVDVRPVSGRLPVDVSAMTVDSHGIVWIVDSSPGVVRFRPSDRDFKRFVLPLDTVDYFQDPLCVIKERNDVVWMKMRHSGFGYYDRDADMVRPFLGQVSSSYHMTNGVVAFEVDKDNVMWMSPYYERGLFKIVIDDVVTRSVSGVDKTFPENVRALCVDPAGNIWAGTKGGRLNLYDADYNLLSSFGESDGGQPLGRVYSVFCDSDGSVWAGTKGNGLWRLRPDGGRFRFRHYVHSDSDPYSLSNDNVYCVAQDTAGRIWVATFGGGVNILSGDGKFLNPYNSISSYPLQEGARARYILCDGTDKVFVATTEGLMLCDPSERPEDMSFHLYRHSPSDHTSIGGNDVTYLMKDSASRVWACTYGGGLGLICSYAPDGTPEFRNYTVVDGLLDNMVLSAVEDREGNVWVASEKGVARLDRSGEMFTDCSILSSASGVCNEAAAVIDSRGTVLFGGTEGLLVYDSRGLLSFGYDYRLRFTDLSIMNAQDEAVYGVEGEFVLPYDYMSFRIDFASLNFRLQDKVNYSYCLEGYDGGWTDSRKVNSASYSKVPPGRYRFRVKAYVGNERMSGPEISVALRVEAPPYLRWYAWCAYVLLAGALVWLILHSVIMVSRLRAETRMEQRMSEVKARFFTDMSHELRTPLTLIIGGLEDLRRRGNNDSPDKGGESLELSYRNSIRMLSLINRLLDFRGKVKDGLDLRVREMDIVLLVQEVSRSFRELAEEHGISFRMQIPPGPVMVWADRDRIESVLYNLLSNAFKFTPDAGSITVSVSSSDGQLTVEVADTGIGLSRRQAAKVFGRYARFHEAVRDEVRGSGIGLSLCKEIIEMHHGTISVESEPGKGSIFSFVLPSGNAHFHPEQIDLGDSACWSGDSAADHVQHEPPSGAPKVLFVDDNPEIRRFVASALSSDYLMSLFADGLDAMDRISSDPPDIVVTDIMMPGLDGIGLLERIRADFETSHIPVIMLTAKHSYEDRIAGLRYGADAYITKPFSVDYLKAGIDNLLARRRTLFEHFAVLEGNTSDEEAEQEEMMLTGRDRDFLSKLKEWLDSNVTDPDLEVGDLAQHLGLGRTTMYNKVKALTGKSPVELIRENRLLKAKAVLAQGDLTVSEVAWRFGFSDPAYFSRCFKVQFGVSPSEYLRRCRSDK